MTGRPTIRAAAVMALAVTAFTAALANGTPGAARQRDRAPLAVTAVRTIGLTVSDLDRAVRFYTRILQFVEVERTEAAGRPLELLTGVFGARVRTARLRLGAEEIELTEFLAPRGRPMPGDVQPNDLVFQHAAIVVSDMDRAYAALRAAGVEHASTGPQRLPDWNPNAGGIRAFYFRDPDRHFLEIIQFPPGKASARWQERERLFLGIDHTAIVVANTDQSLAFYRDTLGLALAGESENHDVEQEHLNNVFGARLRITALRAAAGPGIELLEYLAPRHGRPAPADLRASDAAHWQTTVVTTELHQLVTLAREHRVSLVSPGPVTTDPQVFRFHSGALVRDPDGHGVRLVSSNTRHETFE